jgi:lysophospholipase L1-like esterase
VIFAPRRILAVAVSLTAIAGVVSSSTASAQVTTASYVALGDSYTAGPFIPLQQQPWGCLKSDHNYPHLMAPATGLPLRDASCSGATTGDMTSAQGVTPGPNPPQFSALDAGTTLVTLGIGGNDIGFSDIAKGCFSASPLGTPCQDRYVVNGEDQISARIAATGAKVAAALQGIHGLSPQARVFLVGYPAIFPESGLGCWPLLPIAFADVPYLRAKEKELNAMLATEAAANQATFVDTYTPSIGHDACELPVIRWVEPAVPASPAAPVHPNLFGMQGMSAAVLSAVLH